MSQATISYQDFLLSTREVRVSTPDMILSEATKHTYLLGIACKGRDKGKTFQGGSKLVDFVQTDTIGNFSGHVPNRPITPKGRDVLKKIEQNWAMYQTNLPIVEEEMDLNKGDRNRFLDLRKSHEQAMRLDMLNGLEGQITGLPNFNTQEKAVLGEDSERLATPLLAFITRDGLAPSSTNGGVVSGTPDWTSIQQVDPTTSPWWRNAIGTYSASDPDDLDTGLISGMDSMVLSLQFEMPNEFRKWQQDERVGKQIILTNKNGVTFYQARLRALNDRMANLKDPAIVGPQFNGIPVKYIADYDNLGWTTNQPDYVFVNFNYLYPIFHSKWFMRLKMVHGGVTQPNTDVLFFFTWMNFFCQSRRRQGRLSAA